MKIGSWFAGVVVEWDERKNQENIKKHGLSFRTATLVFSDVNLVVSYDAKHSAMEDRYKVIGVVDGVIAVICTERKEKIRIISARHASAEERKAYYGSRRIYS